MRLLHYIFIILSLNSFSQTRTSLECVEREFCIVVHVLNDEEGESLLEESIIHKNTNTLNNEWDDICMKFNICEIKQVKNYNFKLWHQDTMENEFLAIYYVPRVINIIIVEDILKPTPSFGYATYKGISNDSMPYIVINSSSDSSVWIHEMGHYFGLLHTFEEPIGQANNSDCSTSSDSICDTEADPNSIYDITKCEYRGTIQDANGEYYNPLVENFMSYYNGCRSSFTHEQYETMIKTYRQNPRAHF